MHGLDMSVLLHRALEARLGRLMEILGGPAWAGDPGALHDARVASRRVRAVLDLVRPDCYPGLQRHRRALRRLTRALGTLRELDVHTAFLEDLAWRLPGVTPGAALEHALEGLDRQRRKRRAHLAADLPLRGLRRLPELLEVPSLPEPFRPSRLADDVWAALGPRFDEAFALLPGLLELEDPEALHRARIRLKRLRYALEALAGAWPEPPAPALAGLKDLQAALGEHHDLATLESGLQRLLAGLEGRGRRILAQGLVELLACAGDARLAAFHRFRTAAAAAPSRPLRSGLRLGLGLPEEETP
ncbi:CHAD domain-containing protein [Mesoterricola sediminis]|uniref:CHAD domain-containing protein n=1 Tax=Mesoterricola sediminis TaxID=2927980 RepID=A0AA48GYS2_9BACT|nr:CHAD domain-containing protein [Mesoterricola sediminis]BDU78749.1 hypothetical protein METESE_37070 [Mesoterricola sediminis]